MNIHNKATAKGTKSAVKDRFLGHDKFVDVVRNGATIMCRQNTIRSRGHQLASYSMTKVSLTPCDTKRWIDEGQYRTRALGHYKCAEDEAENVISGVDFVNFEDFGDFL